MTAIQKGDVKAAAEEAAKQIQEVRRKTEQGTSAVAFTRGAAGRFDKSRASAPPQVLEERRSGVQTYFVRKQ